jgi:hypothetical protein
VAGADALPEVADADARPEVAESEPEPAVAFADCEEVMAEVTGAAAVDATADGTAELAPEPVLVAADW